MYVEEGIAAVQLGELLLAGRSAKQKPDMARLEGRPKKVVGKL